MADEATAVEEKARGMGWVSKEEFKGDPEKWRPAEEFVERGENILPILKDRVAKLEEELRMTIKVNKADIEKVKAESYERAKKEYNTELERLRKEKFEAVQSGDVKEYTRLEQQEKALKEPEKPAEQPADGTPVFQEWRGKNAWYQTDSELTEFANFFGQQMQKKSPGMDEKAFLEAVGKEVKNRFPEKFTNPNREKPDGVEGGGHTPSRGGKKTWADLPDSAKSAYSRLANKFEQKGRKLDKDTYVKEYFEE